MARAKPQRCAASVGEASLIGAPTGEWTLTRIHELFLRLAARRGNLGAQLSGSAQEMLAIARALLINPRLLVLDEPSQGVRELFAVIAAARDTGLSVLLVDQNVRAAVEIADCAYVLDEGRVVYEGPADELAADEARGRALAGASAETWTEVRQRL